MTRQHIYIYICIYSTYSFLLLTIVLLPISAIGDLSRLAISIGLVSVVLVVVVVSTIVVASFAGWFGYFEKSGSINETDINLN